MRRQATFQKRAIVGCHRVFCFEKAHGSPPQPPDETLDETVLVRLTPTEKALYSGLAKADGRSLSSWVRRACEERARAAEVQAWLHPKK